MTDAGMPTVLFVCVHNAGRSQMAAALLAQHAAGRVQVLSAGSTPAAEINPAVVQVMAEVGLDLSTTFPKPLTDDAVQAADVVISMGCGDACPVFPGKRYLDWQVPDPAGLSADQIRPIRDDLDVRVHGLIAALDATELGHSPRRSPAGDATLPSSVQASAARRDTDDRHITTSDMQEPQR